MNIDLLFISLKFFSGLTDTPSAEVANFTLSFVPSSPFRVLSRGFTATRRPNCNVGTDYCLTNPSIVLGCQSNRVTERRGLILNRDRIYLTSGFQTAYDCRNGVAGCCGYVSALVASGLCPNRASDALFTLPEEHHDDDNDEHNDHHNNNNNNHHDDHHDDDDHHNHHDDDNHWEHDEDRHEDDEHRHQDDWDKKN